MKTIYFAIFSLVITFSLLDQAHAQQSFVVPAAPVTSFAPVASAAPVTSFAPVASAAPATGGVGTEMTQMINRLGLGSDCARCKNLAAEMDANGAQWVENNFDYVVSRTVSNAQNLGHRMGPIRRAGVRGMVRSSIRRSQ